MNEKEILNTCIQNDFRAEEMKTVLNNRIWLCNQSLKWELDIHEIEKTKAKIETYKDCLEILNKEFFELDILDEIGIEEYIKTTRDRLVNTICPIDDRARGSSDYRRNMHYAGTIATIIESLCYQMVNYGYKLKSESV